MIKRFTLFDAGLIAALLCAAALFFPYLQSRQPSSVAVFRDNDRIARYPLSENSEFTVRGRIGSMRVRVQNGAVCVLSSTCPEQICVKTAPIRKTMRQIICQPNHIVLEIESRQGDSVDAVTQ